MYGENCSRPCGHCLESKQCHHINGTCTNGCDSGYQGSLCTEGKHISTLKVNSDFLLNNLDHKWHC